jgi:sugar lactone lactonase YvrE
MFCGLKNSREGSPVSWPFFGLLSCSLLLFFAPDVTGQDIITNYAGGGQISGKALAWSVPDPCGLVRDAAGNLYIATVRGNVVLKLDTGGQLSVYAGTGVGGYTGDGGPARSAQLFIPLGLALDRLGNLFIADNVYNVVRRVDAITQIITTVAGNGSPGYDGDNGPATSASLNSPYGVSVDAHGNLFVADGLNNVIRRVDAITGVITTVAGDFARGGAFSGDGGPATAASLHGPRAVAIDSAGNLFFADTDNSCVRRVDATTQIVTTVAGQGQRVGDSGDGGPATSATLTSPAAIFLDANDNLFISDRRRIRRVDAATQVITTVAGSSIQGFAGDGGPATRAELDLPVGIAADSRGNLFFSDGRNNRIRAVNTSGTIETVAGGGSEGDGGPATSAVLAGSAGLGITPSGDLLIGDVSAGRVWKVEASTGDISTIAGDGIRDTAGDGGPATSSGIGFLLSLAADRSGNTFLVDNTEVRRIDAITQDISTVVSSGIFSSPPNGIAVDSLGALYLSDFDKSVVDRVDPTTGTLTIVAGTPGAAGYSGDGGLANAATLDAPAGLAFDSADNLFIVEQGNNVVRRVDAATGVITTIAGTGSAGFSGDGGPATSAQLSLPFSIAFDTFDNLFIGDGRNKRIRRVSALTGLMSTVAGNGSSIWSGDGGDALLAGIGSTFALAFDSKNHLFQSDPDFNRVRQILLTPQANLSFTNLIFPATQVGQTSAAQSVVLTNVGDGAMSIRGVSLVGLNASNFNQANQCSVAPAILAPGASCVFLLTFSPSNPGNESATLQVSDDAAGSPHSVLLSGIGASNTAGFTLAVPADSNGGSGATASVLPGKAATFTVILQPNLGFVGPITLTCQSVIPSATCTARPASISVMTTPSSPITLTITVQTAGVAQVAAEQGGPRTMASLSFFVTISGAVLLAIWWRKASGTGGGLAGTRGVGLASTVAALLLLSAVSFAGCGSNPPHTLQTPPGTYQLSVVASAPGGVNQSISLMVQVI